MNISLMTTQLVLASATARTSATQLGLSQPHLQESTSSGDQTWRVLAWGLRMYRRYQRHKAQRHNMRTGLYRLPTELIDEIVLHLQIADILCLARTCQKTMHVRQGPLRKYVPSSAISAPIGYTRGSWLVPTFQRRAFWRTGQRQVVNRLKRDRRAGQLVDEGQDLRAREWCSVCCDFHLNSSFEKGQLEVATDQRKCKYWRSKIGGYEWFARIEREELQRMWI